MEQTRSAPPKLFALGWDAEVVYPPQQQPYAIMGGAPPTECSWSKPRGTASVDAGYTAGAEHAVDAISGRFVRLGVGNVFEGGSILWWAPTLAKPPANAPIHPDTIMHWWDFAVRLNAPSATFGRRVCWGIKPRSSSDDNAWTVDGPANTVGSGITVCGNGAGGLQLIRKALNVLGPSEVVGPVGLPAGRALTDWIRYWCVILAATQSRRAKFRLYQEEELLYETEWGDNGTGTGNPEYGAYGGYCLKCEMDGLAHPGMTMDIASVFFRRGRYDVNGAELSNL